MKNNLWQRKIPTLLGILLIAASIIGTSFLAKNGSDFISKASPNSTPKDIRISNITDTSFTVSFITTTDSLSGINFGEKESLGTSAFDDRDQENYKPRKIHYVTIKNLKPSVKYYFSILSNGQNYLNNDSQFQVQTVTELSETEGKKITGKAIMPDGSIPQEGIVYLTKKNDELSSALLNNGDYEIEYQNSALEMLITTPEMSSKVTFDPLKTDKIPVVTLSKNYDFTIGSLPVDSSPQDSLHFPSYSSSLSKTKEPEIIRPKNDEQFVDVKPLFSGVASPSAQVEVTIRSEEIKGKVTADRYGNWSFRAPGSISPGEHTVTIKTKDENGILKVITRNFTVYAQGSQVSESATPSATPKITVPPIKTPTPTVLIVLKVTLTPTPVVIPSPTPTVILIPTKAPLPSVGSREIIASGLISIGIFTASLILFLLSRGNISL